MLTLLTGHNMLPGVNGCKKKSTYGICMQIWTCLFYGWGERKGCKKRIRHGYDPSRCHRDGQVSYIRVEIELKFKPCHARTCHEQRYSCPPGMVWLSCLEKDKYHKILGAFLCNTPIPAVLIYSLTLHVFRVGRVKRDAGGDGQWRRWPQGS